MNSPLSSKRLGRLYDAMSGYVERGEVPGIVTMIYHRGEVHAEAFGALTTGGAPVRRDSIFRIASMTKPIIAAAAMILVEECRLRLDEPVDELLPELAGRRVLRRLDGPVDDTEAANRPITLRDLLTFRLGFGAVMAPPGTYPIQQAIADAGLAPAPTPPAVTPDEWMKRLGQLPLLHQPGEAWMYHTGSDILGVLIARASGQGFEAFLKQRLFEPLGMKDTGFHVPAAKSDRLPAVHALSCGSSMTRRTAHGRGRPSSPPAGEDSSPQRTTISPSAGCCSAKAGSGASGSSPVPPSSS